MPIGINGSGTITGISAGGLPSGTVTQATIATGVAGEGPAFYAYNSSATALGAGTTTKVGVQTEIFDTDNCFDTGNSRFLPTVAGYYQIGAASRTDSTTSYLTVYIYKNGSVYAGGSFSALSQGAFQSNVSAVVYLNGTTDYVELYTFTTSAVNTTTGAAATFISGGLLRAA